MLQVWMRQLSQAGANALDEIDASLPVARKGDVRYLVTLHTIQPLLTRAVATLREVVVGIRVGEEIDEVKVARRTKRVAWGDTFVVDVRDKPSLVAVVGCRMEFGLFVFCESLELGGIEEMVSGKVSPEGHATDACLRDVDGFQPGPQFVGFKTA